MDIRIGDKLTMKKPHPCGNNEFKVFRVGMDFKMRCTRCLHEVMMPRAKAEKFVKKIDTSERENTNA